MIGNTKSGFFTVIFFLLIIFFGCSIKEGVKNKTSEEILRDRVMTYWELNVRGEFDKSYEYEDPLFRKTVSMVDYIRGHNRIVQVRKAAVKSVTFEDGAAMVELKTTIELRVPGAKPLITDTDRKEKWEMFDGIWYHIGENRSLQGMN